MPLWILQLSPKDLMTTQPEIQIHLYKHHMRYKSYGFQAQCPVVLLWSECLGPPKFICWNLTPKGESISIGDFGRWLCPEEDDPMNGLRQTNIVTYTNNFTFLSEFKLLFYSVIFLLRKMIGRLSKFTQLTRWVFHV